MATPHQTAPSRPPFRPIALATLLVASCEPSQPARQDQTGGMTAAVSRESGAVNSSPHASRDRADANELSAVVAAEARPSDPSEVEQLTGVHTRVVWIQDVGDGTDFNSKATQLVLMGYDTRDEHRERPILSTPSNYAKPFITPKGNRVVFSDRQQGSIFIVNWDGSGLRQLADGFALAVWRDPDTGVEWVYAGSHPGPPTAGRYQIVERYQIDSPEVSELIWDTTEVSEDNFQLSADGRRTSGTFPWPAAGVADLPSGSWRKFGEGCWTALSPDNSYLLWYFDGSHRNLTIVDVDRDKRWQVNINDAPGIEGYEVYHPRWSNHPQFLTMTGPYTAGTRANKIRAGGQQVEIYVGRFADDFASVEQWVTVTDNGFADFYPDAWIDPSGRAAVSALRERPDAAPGPADLSPPSADIARVVVQGRLRDVTAIPTPESIEPYRHALVVNGYEIVEVIEGNYDAEKIMVAQWAIRERQVLSTARRQQGTVYQMTLELFDDHPELEGERLVMDSDDFNLRLYYDVGQ